jgi:hypothetical protein
MHAFLATRPHGQDIDAPLAQLIDDTLRQQNSLLNKFIIILQETWLVVPDEIKGTLTDLDSVTGFVVQGN